MFFVNEESFQKDSEGKKKGSLSLLKDKEHFYRNKLGEMGFSEFINPYTVSRKDLILQGLKKEEYLSTKEGFIPLCIESSWLSLAKVARENLPLPIKMFTVSPLPFKRNVLSLAILGSSEYSENPEELIERVLEIPESRIDFTDSKVTSTLRSKGVWKKFKRKSTKVGDFGYVNSSVLLNYGIEEPFFILNVDLASLISLETGKDKGEVLYPHLVSGFPLDDEEVAEMIKSKASPSTELGKLIAKKVKKEIQNLTRTSKGETKLFNYEVPGKGNLEIWMVNRNESGAISSDIFNELYVWKNNLYFIPKSLGRGVLKEVKEEGFSTGMTLLDSIADKVAFEAESMREWYDFVEFKDVESLEEANIKLPSNLRNIIGSVDFDLSVEIGFAIKIN